MTDETRFLLTLTGVILILIGVGALTMEYMNEIVTNAPVESTLPIEFTNESV